MNALERIASLQESAGTRTPIEEDLLTGEIVVAGPVITGSPGHSHPLMVVFDSHRTSYFKRFADQDPNLCRQYGHHPFDVPVNEVTAWRLANAMGNPWRALVPTAVLRTIDNAGGALINGVPGKNDPTVFIHAPVQVAAAAFWDALIGQQDRNLRNYRYDSKQNRLGLIDHGFTFARPGDPRNRTSVFLAARHRTQTGAVLTKEELDALKALLDEDLYGVRTSLDTARADALNERATRMLETKCLLPVVSSF